MANTVKVDEKGFLRQAYIGPQTYDSMAKTIAELIKVSEKLKKEGKPVYGLVDLSKLGNMTPSARKIATDAVRHFPYDKAAMYGANTFNNALVNLVLLAAGKNRQIKLVKTEAEAISWIKGTV